MGQGRFGHDRILSGVIVCHVVGNNGVFPERGSRGPCVGFWVPGSIWQRMWYFCAKFLWIKGVFYHGLCVIIYAGRIVPCLHWYLIRVIGRMTSLEWFSIWETSNNIINFNDVRKRLWKLVSMMMFSPCVFCVLPCVTSIFTVSKLARIIKQASRVGGCERVFTPVRWRQVRLSCIKWRSTFFFFLYFFVRPSFGKNGKDWNPAIPLVKRIFLVPDHIWPKTIKGQPALTHVIRNYVLLLVVPPLCLWWVTHSDESAQAQNSSRATTTLVSQPPHSNG